VEPAGEAVPYELIFTGGDSGHDEPAVNVFRSLEAWREHWPLMHHRSHPGSACPEPDDLSGRMIIEIAAGSTSTGMVRLEVTAVEMELDNLAVQATLHYPRPSSPTTCDVGNPVVVLAAPAFDGPVYLDLSVMHGVSAWAPPVVP
jgi:hypothetical protein